MDAEDKLNNKWRRKYEKIGYEKAKSEIRIIIRSHRGGEYLINKMYAWLKKPLNMTLSQTKLNLNKN